MDAKEFGEALGEVTWTSVVSGFSGAVVGFMVVGIMRKVTKTQPHPVEIPVGIITGGLIHLVVQAFYRQNRNKECRK